MGDYIKAAAVFVLGVTFGPGSVFVSMYLATEGRWLEIPGVLVVGVFLASKVADWSERNLGSSVRTIEPWNPFQ